MFLTELIKVSDSRAKSDKFLKVMSAETEVLHLYRCLIEINATELEEGANALNSMFVLILKDLVRPSES